MTVALAAAAVFLGAGLQSATGFGFALVSAPILFALLGPREAVTAGVIVGVLLNGLTLATERRRPQVLVRDAVALVAWSLPGIVLGVLALRSAPEHAAVGRSSRWRCSPGSRCACAISRAAAPPRSRRWHVPAAGFTRRRAVDVDLAERPAARLLPARTRRAARAAA